MKGGVPADARLEVKFVAPVAQMGRIQAWLRLHPAAFRVAFPNRWVNNVYFDSHRLSAYGDNVAGVSGRTKLRYRWYGLSEHPDRGNLEIKYRRNCFGWKRLFPGDAPPHVEGQSWREFRERIGRQMGAEARLWLSSRPTPVILNRYYRQYYVSADGGTRVTIDSRQRVYDQRYSSVPNLERRANIPELLVVEFKCRRADREKTSRVIQGLPIRVGRHSKYAVAVRSLV